MPLRFNHVLILALVMHLRVKHMVIFGLILSFSNLGVDGDNATDWTDSRALTTSFLGCTEDADCEAVDIFSICEMVNISIAGVVQEAPRCVCDERQNFINENGICVYQAQLGETCRDIISKCVANLSYCQEDGGNVGNYRCICESGYVRVDTGNKTYECVPIIFGLIDPACDPCEYNEGVCYDMDFDGKRDGCICNPSRSGVDCEYIHVNVTCDPVGLLMTVCYEPHNMFNFVPGGSVMMVDGKGQDEACKGRKVNDVNDICRVGQYKIILPLIEGQRERCGTLKLMSDVVTRRYESKIVVQLSPKTLSPEDKVFKAFCSFETHVDSNFMPVGIVVINQNDRGQHQRPGLTMVVENHLGNPIPEGVKVRLGDKITFKIFLDTSGAYAAIHILRCTASTRATIPNPKAITKPLIAASCPAPDQTIVTNINNWKTISGKQSQLKTGTIVMFKMPEGHSVHFHCSIRVCLKGSEIECAGIPCDQPATHVSFGRRRRAVEERETDVPVHREILWDDGTASQIDKDSVDKKTPEGANAMTPPAGSLTYAMGMAGATAVIMLCLVLAAMFYKRMKKMSNAIPKIYGQPGMPLPPNYPMPYYMDCVMYNDEKAVPRY